MSNKEKVSQLSKELRRNEFSFIIPGLYNLEDINSMVKLEFKELCIDDYKCFNNCVNGSKSSPEWKHVIRNVLNDNRFSKNSRVIKMKERGVWKFL